MKDERGRDGVDVVVVGSGVAKRVYERRAG